MFAGFRSAQSRSKRAPSLPLVLGVPMATDQGAMLVIGIPPLDTDDERKKSVV